MDDSAHHSEAKSEVAQQKPRDEHGHFVHTEDKTPDPVIPNSHTPNSSHTNPLTQFLHDETAVHKGSDDELIDIHIGNPLRKIQILLEEIKRQKAFSFTLKGSLGIMGVALALGTFGIFGGTKALCDKGIQTKLGVVKELSYQEEESVSFLNDLPIINMLVKKPVTNRTILMTPTNQLIHLVLKRGVSLPVPLTLNANPSYFVTGNFDTCSETLNVTDQTALQPTQ